MPPPSSDASLPVTSRNGTSLNGNRAGPAFSFAVPVGPEAAVAARRATVGAGFELPTAVSDDVLLLITELVTNAVRHAGAGPGANVAVALRRHEGDLRVEVTDAGPRFATMPERPGHEGVGGWGLFLVDRIADRWGVEPAEPGTRVWFEVRAEV